jgi:hypothetical protein
MGKEAQLRVTPLPTGPGPDRGRGRQAEHAWAMRPGSRSVDVGGIVRSPHSLFVGLHTGALQSLGAQPGYCLIPGED